jgi:hypothetical protein
MEKVLPPSACTGEGFEADDDATTGTGDGFCSGMLMGAGDAAAGTTLQVVAGSADTSVKTGLIMRGMAGADDSGEAAA